MRHTGTIAGRLATLPPSRRSRASDGYWEESSAPASKRVTEDRPDELRLRRAGKLLSEFGMLWRNPEVPDRLREEALREIFGRLDVDGPEIVAAYPQPNENAWLLGLVGAREQRLLTQGVMGLVGARGFEPPVPTPEIVVPDWISRAIRAAG